MKNNKKFTTAFLAVAACAGIACVPSNNAHATAISTTTTTGVSSSSVSGAVSNNSSSALSLWTGYQTNIPVGSDAKDHGLFSMDSVPITSSMTGKTIVLSVTGKTNVATVDSSVMGVQYNNGSGWVTVNTLGSPIVNGSTTGVKAVITSAMVGHSIQMWGSLKTFNTSATTVTISGKITVGSQTWSTSSVLSLPDSSSTHPVVPSPTLSTGSDMGVSVPSTDFMWRERDKNNNFTETEAEYENRRDKILDQVAATGAKYLRMDVDMCQLTWTDPATGKPFYDWNTLDNAVAAVKAHGLTPVGILQTLSDYALPANQQGLNRTGPTTPAELDAFNTYVKNVVSHVGGNVNYWEVWNEENLVNFWGGGNSNNPNSPAPSAAAYAKLLQIVTPTIHSANPKATVVSGGTGGAFADPKDVDAVQYVKDMYASGAQNNFDALAIHAYADAQNINIGEFNRLGVYRSVMDSYGDTKKQLWITESGTKVAEAGNGSKATEQDQSYLEPQMIASWKQIHDHGPMFVFSLEDDVDPGYGLLRADGTPRPAYQTLVAEMNKPL